MAIAPPPGPPAPAGPPHIAILLPLTGPMANIGGPMLQAAQLALSQPGSPILDVHDTAGDPQRAAAEAEAALAAGDRLILGPLTAAETNTVGAVAATPPPGTPPVAVLAFTSDPAAASQGVWTLGLTPNQQVRRLVTAAREDGRQHLAAILPEGALGDALQSSLEAAAADSGMETPTITRSEPGLVGFTAALRTASNFDSRRGDLEAHLKSLREQTDPAARAQAAELAAQPVAPPPFDALLIGEFGPTIVQASEILGYYDATSPQVRVMGPALWGQQAGQLGHMAGAWYAAFDPAARQVFAAAFQGKYGVPPSSYADFAFDAAAIAHVLAGENDFSTNALTRPEGFTGVDGAMALLPDGRVRRALAIFQINSGGGASIVSQAPEDLSQPGS
jgi:ABC-type branched-subunit amino acid transport system substrate-binding protein